MDNGLTSSVRNTQTENWAGTTDDRRRTREPVFPFISHQFIQFGRGVVFNRFQTINSRSPLWATTKNSPSSFELHAAAVKVPFLPLCCSVLFCPALCFSGLWVSFGFYSWDESWLLFFCLCWRDENRSIYALFNRNGVDRTKDRILGKIESITLINRVKTFGVI